MAEADPQFDDEFDDSSPDAEQIYVPDVQSLFAGEMARALLVVLSRRLGPDFAREVHNEIYARTAAYEESCPDDRRDGHVLENLLSAPFWDPLLADADRVTR